MMPDDPTFWTIHELGDRVAESLASDYEGVPSGRVRDVPDLRTIRYYTTLGLLDRPAALRGRTALYGRRHLLQLLAIKRLQAQGLSLAAIQRRLIGLSDSALGEVAQLPPDAERPRSRSDRFWRQPPTAVDPGPSESAPERHGGAAHRARVRGVLPVGVGLALTLETCRPLDEEDLRVIRLAAAPLREILVLRGLIDPEDRGETR
jgi:DNA-binding transcriptional MerR regulator